MISASGVLIVVLTDAVPAGGRAEEGRRTCTHK